MLRDVLSRTITPTYIRVRSFVTDAVYERRYGISTTQVVSLDELGFTAQDNVQYVPSGWSTLQRILPHREVSTDDVFVDFGSGKGRVLLLASAYPFRRVVGVELSSELVAISRRNIEQHRVRFRCSSIEVVEGDVQTFDVPDDMTYAFLYNPVRGRTFDTVIDNILRSVDRCPRPVRIIYRDPEEEARMLATGRIRTVRTLRGYRPSREWSRAHSIRMYEVIPTAAPA